MNSNLSKIAEDSTRGGFFLTLGHAASTIISAASLLIVARILGPEQYGLYSISTVIPSLLLLFIDPGINQGLIKYTASLKVKGEEHHAAKLLTHALAFKILLGLAATFLCFALSNQLATHILNRPDLTPYIQAASTLIILQTIYTTVNSSLVGLDKTEYNAFITCTQAIVKALASSLLVILGLSIIGALTGYIAGSLAASLIAILILYRVHKQLYNSKDTTNTKFSGNIRLLVRYGFPLYISALLAGFILQYQNLLLATFTSNEDIGNYRATMNFTTLVNILPASIVTALLSTFSKLDHKSEEANRFFRLSIKYASMLVLPTITILALYSKEIVEIVYGEAYLSAPFFLTLCTLQYYLIGSGSLILDSLFNGLGDTKTTLKIHLVSSSAFIIAAPATTWILKAPGLIVATFAATLLGNLCGLSIAKSKFKVQIETGTVARIYLSTLFSASLILLLNIVLPLTGLPRMILGGSIYLAAYLLLTPLMKVISQPEMEGIKAVLHKVRPLETIAKPLIHLEETILTRLSASPKT